MLQCCRNTFFQCLDHFLGRAHIYVMPAPESFLSPKPWSTRADTEWHIRNFESHLVDWIRFFDGVILLTVSAVAAGFTFKLLVTSHVLRIHNTKIPTVYFLLPQLECWMEWWWDKPTDMSHWDNFTYHQVLQLNHTSRLFRLVAFYNMENSECEFSMLNSIYRWWLTELM